MYFGRPSVADDAGFLRLLLEALVAEGTARADSVYIAGFSNGGLMALTLACGTGGVRPAGLVIAAATLAAAGAAGCHLTPPLAFVLANGTADPLFPYAGGMGMVNGRAGDQMLSATATAEFFARANGCGSSNVVSRSSETMGWGDGAVVTRFAGCPKSGSVLQITVTGGGHVWPPEPALALGEAIGASRPATLAELAWSMFRSRFAP